MHSSTVRYDNIITEILVYKYSCFYEDRCVEDGVREYGGWKTASTFLRESETRAARSERGKIV